MPFVPANFKNLNGKTYHDKNHFDCKSSNHYGVLRGFFLNSKKNQCILHKYTNYWWLFYDGYWPIIQGLSLQGKKRKFV